MKYNPPGTGSIPQEWVKSPRHRQVPLGTGRFPQEWAKSPRNGQKSKKNRKRELRDKKHKKIAREQERMRKIQKKYLCCNFISSILGETIG